MFDLFYSLEVVPVVFCNAKKVTCLNIHIKSKSKEEWKQIIYSTFVFEYVLICWKIIGLDFHVLGGCIAITCSIAFSSVC